MFFGYYQFHESNYAILHMQKGAIASQEKHIKGIQFLETTGIKYI